MRVTDVRRENLKLILEKMFWVKPGIHPVVGCSRRLWYRNNLSQ